jgi:mono/diheme cytochrome c family protein
VRSGLAVGVALLGIPALVASAQTVTPPFRVRPLTAFARVKAERLLRERLPCLGCHELRGEGGRIGPDLTNVGARRDAATIAALIRDPQRVVPGAIMPAVPMSESTLVLVTRYLAEGAGAAAPPSPASPGRPEASPARLTDPVSLYGAFCAPCHGAQGRGDGPNAAFLPVRPTDHTSTAYLSARSDDALYDAIAAGGYVMGRSARMPPFGGALDPGRIRALVRYLRELCRCEGPEWSRTER